MDTAAHDQERNVLFAALGGLTLAVAASLVALRGSLLIPRWALAAIVVPWIAFSILLRLRRETIGKEGRVFDWWSVPHFLGGVVLGLYDVPFLFVAAVVIIWELVETVCCIYEHLPNRIADVVLALGGWTLVQFCCTGAFAMH